MNFLNDYGVTGILALAIYILIRDVTIPMWKKHNGKNPVSLERLHQEFKDFKDNQGNTNREIKRELTRLDGRIDKIINRRE